MFVPSYIRLFQSSELKERIEILNSKLMECTLCPRRCGVNRINGEIGYCRGGKEITISSAFSHFGEEAPLVGVSGSGTIFLTHSNLRCLFCQNYDISHHGNGTTSSLDKITKVMIKLQTIGCNNINFVTPTHFTPQIVEALPQAITMGLNVPLVYNCGGYEAVEVLELLEEIVDIYMPDMKFMDGTVSQKYCKAPDYPEVVKAAIKEMHRQVGDAQINEHGIMERGLLVRHLVMPNSLAGSSECFRFLAEEISKDTYINIMAQYYPCYEASRDEKISRRITSQEYQETIKQAKKYGLHRGFLE